MEKCRFPLTSSALSHDNDASREDNLGPSLFLPLPQPSLLYVTLTPYSG